MPKPPTKQKKDLRGEIEKIIDKWAWGDDADFKGSDAIDQLLALFKTTMEEIVEELRPGNRGNEWRQGADDALTQVLSELNANLDKVVGG